MDIQNIFVIIVVGLMVTGFVYVNVIFPKRIEEEKKLKEEKQKQVNN